MKAASFLTQIEALADWFQRSQRVLPWREDPSPYRVWISEIMLQQTQVATVVPYFERFVRLFPTVEALASADPDSVMSAWAGLGYYSRARNLQRGAQAIAALGRFPRTREEWLEIPGVGPYTAGAILSIAFDEAEAIVDGNVERVLSRVYTIERQTDSHYKGELWKRAESVVRSARGRGIRPSVVNQALMELGATLCTPKVPRCEVCPVSEGCRAFAVASVDRFPPRKKPKTWIEVRESVDSIFDSRGRALLRRRSAGEWRAGLWDLPESDDPVLVGAAKTCRRLGEVTTRHVVTRHRITRVARIWTASELPFCFGSAYAWENDSLALGSAAKKTLSRIREAYPEVQRQTAKPEEGSSS